MYRNALHRGNACERAFEALQRCRNRERVAVMRERAA